MFPEARPFMAEQFTSHDVVWFAKNRKTPIAWSTTADSNEITMLNQEYNGLINVIHAYDNNQILLGKESIEIIQILLSYGITNLKTYTQ